MYEIVTVIGGIFMGILTGFLGVHERSIASR
jgi:hypothetical protein